MEINPIAYISNPFTGKFGIPRQSGTTDIKSRIIFTPEYRDPSALKGIEEFSHLWLVWHFSEAVLTDFSPTVRPPRLGGNKRVGVFASRSPFRPNSLGLSCVKFEGLEKTSDGTVIIVSGADLKNETPIFDIKPYLPAFDRPENAVGSYSDKNKDYRLKVDFPEELLCKVDNELRLPLIEILAEDPRPSYQDDQNRIYGFAFSDYEIKFSVIGEVLTVIGVNQNR